MSIFIQHPYLALVGAVFVTIVSLVAVVLVPTAIVRTAINDSLSRPRKVLWVLLEFFVFPFPEPRWRTMFAALSEKYPCPAKSQ
jgi:hypothetical protein